MDKIRRERNKCGKAISALDDAQVFGSGEQRLDEEMFQLLEMWLSESRGNEQVVAEGLYGGSAQLRDAHRGSAVSKARRGSESSFIV